MINAPSATLPATCFEIVAAGRLIENRSDREWVVEFVTAAGGREVRTVELLTLTPRAEPEGPGEASSVVFSSIMANEIGSLTSRSGPSGHR